MILRSEEVSQTIDGVHRGRFLKELVYVQGPEPLSMVRKRLPPPLAPSTGYHAPVILTHGFGQNRYAWHLSSRSFANYLAHEGFDVYNLDLRGAGRSRRLGARASRSVDEYIVEDLPAALGEALALSQRTRAFVIGHSLGGLVACGAAGGSPERIAGIVAIGTPWHFTRGSRALSALAWTVQRLSAGGLLEREAGGLPVKWIGRWMHAYRAAWDNRALPIPVRAWAPRSIEPDALREYLHRSYDSATLGTLVQLARIGRDGRFVSADGRIDWGQAFEARDVPLLVVAGARDLLAPPDSVRPLYERSRSSDRAYRVVDSGHADLLLGRRAPSTTWPLVLSWLRARLARVESPRAVANGGP